MKFEPMMISDVLRIDLNRIEDDRGFFARSFCSEEFQSRHLFSEIAQINTSYTRHMGTIRGLHFQRAPAAEAKVVRVVQGAIFDVAVDLRSGSETFGHWIAQELSADNRVALYIPEGFAHGFQTMTDDVEMVYLHSIPFSPEYSGGVHFDDPEIGISWPLSKTVISPRDRALPLLAELEPLES